MPRAITLALTTACILVLAAGAAGAQASQPRVSVDDLSPFTVIGAGFPAREAVVVTVQGRDFRLQKTVSSSGTGAFSARWNRTVAAGGCRNPLSIHARAADGTQASWKRLISKNCPPPIDP